MKGINAGRVFKTIATKEHLIHARKPEPDESVNLLSARRSVRSASTPSRSTLSSRQLQALYCVRATRRRPKPPKSASKLTARGFDWNQGCITESTLQGKIRDPTAPPPAHSEHPYAASPLRLPCSPIRPGVFLQIIVEDEQTTARGRLDRAYGNTVLPRRRLAGFPDQILFLSDDSRERRHP